MTHCPHCLKPLQAVKSEHSKEDFQKCKRTWLETLSFFGQGRSFLLPGEEQAIYRAIQENTADAVELALTGARYEPRSTEWNPRDHVDITRVLTRDLSGKPRIQKFLGYGLQQKHKGNSSSPDRGAIQPSEKKEQTWDPQGAEKVKAIMAGLFKGKL